MAMAFRVAWSARRFRIPRVPVSPIARLGRGFFVEARRVVSYATLTVLTLQAAMLRPREGAAVVWSQAARQVVFTGLDAVWLVGLLSAVGSSVLVSAAVTTLAGAEDNRMFVDLLTRFSVRELAPFLTAVLVALRSASAVTVELGSMSARGEIEGIESAGIDPVRLLLLPRFVGMVVATVGLAVVYVVSTFTAAYASAVVTGVLPPKIWVALDYLTALELSDVVLSLGKAALFGTMIASVACYHGLSVRDDVTEIPRRVARAQVEILLHCSLVAAAFALITL